MAEILAVELRHAELGEEGLRCALAAGHDPTDAQASVNYWYKQGHHVRPRRLLTTTTPTAATGCASHPNQELLARWQANVAPSLAELALIVPQEVPCASRAMQRAAGCRAPDGR